MIELRGALKERVEEAIRLVCTEVTPAEILEPYLKNNIPIGVDKMPIKLEYE